MTMVPYCNVCHSHQCMCKKEDDFEHALSLLPDGWFTAEDVRESVLVSLLWQMEGE